MDSTSFSWSLLGEKTIASLLAPEFKVLCVVSSGHWKLKLCRIIFIMPVHLATKYHSTASDNLYNMCSVLCMWKIGMHFHWNDFTILHIRCCSLFILYTESPVPMIRCYRKPFLFILVSYKYKVHLLCHIKQHFSQRFFVFHLCSSIALWLKISSHTKCTKLSQTIGKKTNDEIKTRMRSWYGKVHPWIFLFYVSLNKLSKKWCNMQIRIPKGHEKFTKWKHYYYYYYIREHRIIFRLINRIFFLFRTGKLIHVVYGILEIMRL